MRRAPWPSVALALVTLATIAPATAEPDGKPALAHGGVSPAEAAARATLDRWLAAQNQGKYDDYAALYAPTFTGVKRVGKTVKKLNRAAWLKDRKAMFRAAMKVEAADVRITPAAPGATTGPVVELTQRWASGAFADTGSKRLTLAVDGSAIVAEEMLSSRVLLTANACLVALFPGASPAAEQTGAADGRRHVADVVVLDLGARWACRVEVEREDGVDVSVAVLSFGKRWEVHGRTELAYDVAEDDSGAGEGRAASGTVSFDQVALHASIPVVQVELSTVETWGESRDEVHRTTLYRVDGDELDELVTVESKESSGEASDVTTCELAIESTRSKGWADLTVTCHHRLIDWAAGKTRPEESTEVTRYRWDGSTYVER